MVNYKQLARTHGTQISQTLDSPIMFLDVWELSDVLMALGSILVFGIVFYSWGLMVLALIWCLFIGPKIKAKNNRGVLMHFPYRHLGMGLPGLMNPGKGRLYSD